MPRYALYVRQPREVYWERREVFDTQDEAEALAARLVQGQSDLEYGDEPQRVDEAIVVAAEDGAEVAERLPGDHITPVLSRFSREGLAG